MKTLLSRAARLGGALLVLGATALVAQETNPASPAKAEVKAKNPMVLIKTSLGDVELELFADECPKTVANFLGLAEGTLEFSESKTGEKVKRPYYDGLTFHRVIPNFMAQGGCPLGAGNGGPGFEFEDEINADALGLDKTPALTNGQPHPSLLIQSQEEFQSVIGRAAIHKLKIESQEELEKRQEEVDAAVSTLTVKDVFESIGYVYNSTRGSHPMARGTIAMANSGPNTNGSQFFLNMVDNNYLNGKHTVFGRIVSGLDVVDSMQKVEMDQGSKPLKPIIIESIRRLPEEAETVPAVK
jgi:cyclophilin family peptidyl-prolyl cis-trans isomerase